MLTLKRKPNQRVYAILPDGSRIEIVSETRCKLSFLAPPGVNIVRAELIDRQVRAEVELGRLDQEIAQAVAPTNDAA